MQLLEDDACEQHKHQCDDKLDADQTADQSAFTAGFASALKGQQGVDGRKIECRIAAGQAPHTNDAEQQIQYDTPAEFQLQVGFHHSVKQGQGQFGQCQGQNQGDACLNHAFGKKLADKDTAFGTGYFPHAYFFVAQRSAGGGQRREVECSHEDNQESQSDEKIDGGSVSVVLYVRIREPRMEMNVVQGLESQTHVRLPLFDGSFRAPRRDAEERSSSS